MHNIIIKNDISNKLKGVLCFLGQTWLGFETDDLNLSKSGDTFSKVLHFCPDHYLILANNEEGEKSFIT